MPRDPIENLRFRKRLLAGARSKSAQQELIKACKQDLLFYCNFAILQFNPKKSGREVMPFCSYPFQDEAMATIVSLIRQEADDILLLKKSREMGATWLVLIVFDWLARFYPYQSFLVGSRDEDLVDKTGDPRSLMWKLDFIHDHLPLFLKNAGGERYRINAHIDFKGTGSTIDGTTTNKNLGRGDRRTAVLLDEKAAMPNGFAINAAIADAAHLRIDASTPDGPATAFYDDEQRLLREGKEDHVLRMHWSLHPEKARGLYAVGEHGEVELLDKEYWTPEREAAYKFVPIQPKSKFYKFRSVWYDHTCRNRSDIDIAKNLDMDDEGSKSLFFSASEIARLQRFTRSPNESGQLEYDLETGAPLRWLPDAEGIYGMDLWIPMGRLGKPPADRFYGVAADVAQGTNFSNSVLAVVDFRTREKVASVVTGRMGPTDFAVLAVAVCKWFCGPDGSGALLVWETNGPGIPFGKFVVKDLGYRKVWRRKVESHLTFKLNENPGWGPTRGNKVDLLTQYRQALSAGDYRNYCSKALDECLGYIYLPDGSVEHFKSVDRESDPSGVRSNHGDRVIADALANMLMNFDKREDGEQETVDLEEGYPVGSFGWRREQRRKLEEASVYY